MNAEAANGNTGTETPADQDGAGQRPVDELAKYQAMSARRAEQLNEHKRKELEQQAMLAEFGIQSMDSLKEILAQHQETMTESQKHTAELVKVRKTNESLMTKLAEYEARAERAAKERLVRSIVSTAGIMAARSQDAELLVMPHVRYDRDDETATIEMDGKHLTVEQYAKKLKERIPEWVETQAKAGAGMNVGTTGGQSWRDLRPDQKLAKGFG